MSDRQLADWRNHALTLESEVNKVVVGQQTPVRLITTSIFARGHVLLEGDVGVGKTTLLRAFTRGIGGGYQRIEGTIDLMPNDLVYHTYLGEDGKPHVSPGPLLMSGENLSVFFFNEINRARPQVHSLLLRVMAERSLSAFNSEHIRKYFVFNAPEDWQNNYQRWQQYDLGAMFVEVLTAIKGPDATMQMWKLAKDGIKFEEAFETVYGTPYSKALPIMAKAIALQLGRN